MFPTIDNLYALSELFQLPVDDMLCGNRRRIQTGENSAQLRRLYAYTDRDLLVKKITDKIENIQKTLEKDLNKFEKK